MNWDLELRRVGELFRLKSGDYHATKELDPGEVPLISCATSNHGLLGHFDIPPEKRYRHSLTVAYNGQPLITKYHPYEFGAKDDVAILIPKAEMQDTTLLYVAAALNRAAWRYSYGRKCYRGKLLNVTIPVPVSESGGEIDQDIIAQRCSIEPRTMLPKKGQSGSLPLPMTTWAKLAIADVLDVKRGDFHSISALAPGDYRTVSRITKDNGTVGYYDIPDNAQVYPRGSITVSTVGGDAFVQASDFIATDNVLVCTPKHPLKLSTVFFIAFALNDQKWRYSYGRQCYEAKFVGASIWLPVNELGDLDEEFMAATLKNTTYWANIESLFKTAK